MENLLIWGCGGHGHTVREQAVLLHYNVEQIDRATDLQNYPPESWAAFVAVGDNLSRERIQQELIEKGYRIRSIVSLKADVSCNVTIGQGVYIAQGAIVQHNVVLGDGVLVNVNAVVGHDCHVGEFCHVGPSSTLCGGVQLGRQNFIGVGANVIPKIKTADNITVGAGATVIENLESPGLYVGVPAQKK